MKYEDRGYWYGQCWRNPGLRWARNGHQVVFGMGSPSSEKVQKLKESAGMNACVVSLPDAGPEADVVVLAVPWGATQSTIMALGDLRDKIVIDCANPIAPGLQLALGANTSGGEQVAEWAKGARVVKAFNSTGWENMANPIYHGEPAMMPICGDDVQAKIVLPN